MRRWYSSYKPKGPIKAGIRVTIMTERTNYKVGESVVVIHVLEAIKPGISVDGANHKPVYGEFIDGKLVSEKRPEPRVRRIVGIVRTSPTTDYDYGITTYTFEKPGTHTIQWKPNVDWDKNSIASNLITLNISEN